MGHCLSSGSISILCVLSVLGNNALLSITCSRWEDDGWLGGWYSCGWGSQAPGSDPCRSGHHRTHQPDGRLCHHRWPGGGPSPTGPRHRRPQYDSPAVGQVQGHNARDSYSPLRYCHPCGEICSERKWVLPELFSEIQNHWCKKCQNMWMCIDLLSVSEILATSACI